MIKREKKKEDIEREKVCDNMKKVEDGEKRKSAKIGGDCEGERNETK